MIFPNETLNLRICIDLLHYYCVIDNTEINNNNFWSMYIARILKILHTLVPKGT